MRHFWNLSFLLLAILAGFSASAAYAGTKLSQAEGAKPPYWAGKTFTELKDENDNSLTIKFGKDGRSYHVEWWRSGYQALEGKAECGGKVYADGRLEQTHDCMPLGVEQRGRGSSAYITGSVEKIELQTMMLSDLGVIGPWVTGMAQERQNRLKEELLAKKIRGLITQTKQHNDQTNKPGVIASSTQIEQKPTNNIWAGKRFENLADQYGNVLSVSFSDDGRSYEVKWAFFGEEHNGLIECGGKIEKNGNLRSTGICTPLNNQRQQGRTDGEILGSVEQIEYTGSFPNAGPWNTGLRELKRQIAEEAQLLAKLRAQLGINRTSSQRDGGAKATPTGQGLDTETNKIVSQQTIEEEKKLNAERKRLAAEKRKLSADRKRAFEAAERVRLAAERQKLAAERQKAEIDKLIAERERLAAEKLKLAADRKRALEKAEQARLATERRKLTAQRQKAEIDKLIAERERLAAEKLKLTADRKRALEDAEQARLSAESEKIAAEARRIVAEQQLITEAAERKKLAEEQKRLSMALQELSARQDTLNTSTSQPPLRKGKRVALLIGNNNYETLPSLRNAVYDAESMAKKLNGLGWVTILETNAGRRKISRAMDRFRNQAMFAEASLVFYAGHGIESQGVNYLVPSDSEVQEEADLRYEAIKTGDFLDLMASSRSATNILILDSCRNNPLEQGTRGRKRGLSMQQLPDNLGGTVIIYAAAPGSAAEDGPGGGNGIFTGALLNSLSRKDTSLSAVFSNTFSLVAQKTQNRQRPWKSSSLDERRFRF